MAAMPAAIGIPKCYGVLSCTGIGTYDLSKS